MKISMETVRAIVRPLLTVSGWAVVLYLAFGHTDIQTRVIDATLMMVAFWFGSRTKEK